MGDEQHLGLVLGSLLGNQPPPTVQQVWVLREVAVLNALLLGGCETLLCVSTSPEMPE